MKCDKTGRQTDGQTGGRADSLLPGYFFRVLTDRVTQVRVALTKPNGKGVEQFLEIPTPIVGSFQLRKESSKTKKKPDQYFAPCLVSETRVSGLKSFFNK